MKAILLGTSGFWKELEDVQGLPQRYFVPWAYAVEFDRPESSEFCPSYGLMQFECIARGEEVAVYLQKGKRP